MIYIFETELVRNKPVVFALQKIYGIGKAQSLKICKTLGFSNNFQIVDLTTDQLKKLTKIIETSGLIITTELKKKKIFCFKRVS